MLRNVAPESSLRQSAGDKFLLIRFALYFT